MPLSTTTNITASIRIGLWSSTAIRNSATVISDYLVLENRLFSILVMCGIGEFWYLSVLYGTSVSFCVVLTVLAGRRENHWVNLLFFSSLGFLGLILAGSPTLFGYYTVFVLFMDIRWF